jgi:hypothetical protein
MNAQACMLLDRLYRLSPDLGGNLLQAAVTTGNLNPSVQTVLARSGEGPMGMFFGCTGLVTLPPRLHDDLG